jgi:hypothetical protein
MCENPSHRQAVFFEKALFLRPGVGYLAAEDRSQGLAAQAVGAQRRALTAAAGGRTDDQPGEENL